MGQPLFVRAQSYCERLYKALNVLPFLAGQLDEKIKLNIIGEDLTRDEFWYLQRGQLLEAGAVIAAGGAGVYTGVGFENMNGDVIAIIEEFTLCNPNAGAVTYAYGFGIIGIAVTIVNPNKRDDRMLSSIVPGAISAARFGSYGVGISPNTGNGGFIRLEPGAVATVRGPWIFTGKEQFLWRGQANSAMTIAVRWRERNAEAQELKS